MKHHAFHHFFYYFLMLLVFLSQSLWAVPVQEFQLDNGLKILIKEDHRAPVVVSQIWYKVGSSYEHQGITGISHVLEHMMFKGTPTHPAGSFSRIIAAQGGSENAFTGRDYTAYFQSLESQRLAVSFALEADRMRQLQLPPEEFAKERQVVLEERRLRTDDQPQALVQEYFNGTAFVSSPYHWPVIGWGEDIRAITVDDLRAWYQRWYAPNNATLVVAGDVNPAEVKNLADRYFGPLAKEAGLTPPPRTTELPQRGERRLMVKVPARLPYLVMGYQAPVVSSVAQDSKEGDESWEPYALELLAHILDGDDSARFSRELVRGRQVAATAGAGYGLYSRLGDLFTLDGTPAQGKTLAELETALREQIRQVREQPVTETELERVKVQLRASKVYQRDSLFYQAMQLGMLTTLGLDWRLDETYLDRIRDITPEQLQVVARKYLQDDHLTVAYLEPQPLAAGQRTVETSGAGDYVH